MNGKQYSNQEIEFIKLNHKNMSYIEIAEKLNRPVSSIYNKSFALQLRKDDYERYSEKDDDFIKANYKAMSDIDIAQRIGRTREAIRARRRHLNLIKTPSQIQRKGIFEKGHIPHNAHEDGTITIRKDSKGIAYYHIKVPGSRKMKMLHIHLWEQHNGKIPKGRVLFFLDGNQMNCLIENLECITRKELLRRNQRNANEFENSIKDNPDLMKLHQVAKRLKSKIKKLKKSKRHEKQIR